MTEHDAIAVAPLDAVDHVRGPSGGRLILEYGDYECPYARAAYRQIQRVERASNGVRFAFRHFPMTGIHPHAMAASAAAEAAALQDRFWEMHELLFHRQTALEDRDLRRYAAELDLDVDRFDRDRTSAAVLGRIGRDVESALASRQVLGTPTLFIDGVLHQGGYDVAELLEAAGTVSDICSHLDQIRVIDAPDRIEGCEDCLAIGAQWVHLRMCQSCGRIGCCDSSPNRHASKHARAAGHPVLRSIEPGEDWSWCVIDEVAFVVA